MLLKKIPLVVVFVYFFYFQLTGLSTLKWYLPSPKIAFYFSTIASFNCEIASSKYKINSCIQITVS